MRGPNLLLKNRDINIAKIVFISLEINNNRIKKECLYIVIIDNRKERKRMENRDK